MTAALRSDTLHAGLALAREFVDDDPGAPVPVQAADLMGLVAGLSMLQEVLAFERSGSREGWERVDEIREAVEWFFDD